MNHSKAGSAGMVHPKSYHLNKGPPLYFIMMRFNFKVLLLLISSLVIFTILSFWTRCGGDTALREWSRRRFNPDGSARSSDIPATEEIDCVINSEYTVGCRKEGDEVYIPFSFIHKYFEIFGKLSTFDGVQRFEWHHTLNKIYHPKGKYDPRGVFMHFENYNVEVRDRVKCVSGVTGVPISTQWESQGYHYPTQIAQFGLAHYSKNLTAPEPRRKVIENGDKETARWLTPIGAKILRHYSNNEATHVLNFSTTDAFNGGITLKMDHVLDFVMSVDILLYGNSSLTVVLQNREKRDSYNLHYISSEILITAQEENIYHGIGTSETWCKITRDLIIDFQKGLSYLDKDKSRPKLPRSKLKVVALILRGRGLIDNLTLSSSEHMSQFYDAANWFVANQDVLGGWPIPVRRDLAAGFKDLQSGWYSSMGQGQAISVLSRAYHHSGGNELYLNAALEALKPYKISSSEGGVLASFMDKYNWYEEYPTQPASFVLNGFIYSLLGLYDLFTIAPHETREAKVLFDQGMESLRNMLTLFDMGSTTAYDLRHLTLRIAPNLARWDYHVTHINQLLLLSTLDGDPIFHRTADRWIGYMSGKRAAHN